MHDFHWFTIFIAVNGALLLLLTINVSRLRLKHKISYGDGGNKGVMRAIRVHANGTEQIPIYGLVILALIFTSASSTLLSVLVIVFTLSRVIHAYGILWKKPLLRQAGAVVALADWHR